MTQPKRDGYMETHEHRIVMLDQQVCKSAEAH
jgi:hypothetical protein